MAFLEQLEQGRVVSIRASYQGSSTWLSDHAILTSSKGWNLHVLKSELDVGGDGAMFSFFNFEVQHVEGTHALLAKTPEAFVLGHCGNPSFNQIVELCCGLGGISTGAFYAGMQTMGG
eukprot:s1296_g4.t1